VKCSECIKHDVCKHKGEIFHGFRGILELMFGPVRKEYGEIDEFIGKMCERSKYDKA